MPLSPLGAGDLIDRAVRLYRRHFTTLIAIATPPVVISAAGYVLWTIALRNVTVTGSGGLLAIYIALMVVGFVLITCGLIFNVIVMGGATRNLVTHLIWNEPVSARATYSNVRSRFWGLLGAALLVGVILSMAFGLVFIVWYIATVVFVIGAVALVQIAPGWFAALVGIIVTMGLTFGALWLAALAASRVACVPQVMLVEGRDVFGAIGRSFTLGRGSVRRLLAMALFGWFGAYSALMILIIPLGWYAYLHGINPSPWNAAQWPAWYAIGYSVLTQSSSILLAPVWMLGLSLLYVDARVRHEGFDIELMAERQLGPLPEGTAPSGVSPYAPAIVAGAPPRRERAAYGSSNSILGLK